MMTETFSLKGLFLALFVLVATIQASAFEPHTSQSEGVVGCNKYETLQACHDAVPSGGEMFIPRGTYQLPPGAESNLLTVTKSNITIEGAGETTILTAQDQAPTDAAARVITVSAGVSGVTIRNLKLDGNSHRQVESLKNPQMHCLFLRADAADVTRILLEHLKITGCNGDGITIWGTGSGQFTSRDITASDIEIESVGREGIAIISGDRVTLRNVRCRNLPGGACIHGEPDTDGQYMRDILVEGVQDENAHGVTIVGSTKDPDNPLRRHVIIKNVKIENEGWSSVPCLNIRGIPFSTIADSEVVNCSAPSAVEISTYSSTVRNVRISRQASKGAANVILVRCNGQAGSVPDKCQNTVEDVIVEDTESAGGAAVRGVGVTYSRFVHIQIVNPWGTGIILADAKDNLILNNTITGTPGSPRRPTACLATTGTSNNNMVIGNRLSQCISAPMKLAGSNHVD